MPLQPLFFESLKAEPSLPQLLEEKPEFDLSSLTQEQGQNNGQDNIPNRVVKPEQQTPAPQTKPDSTKPDAKVADEDHKPSQATTDSQAEQPAQEASVKEAVQNESVENSIKDNTPAPLAKQAELPKYRNQKRSQNSCLQELVSSPF